eukprot:scaffold5803_cov40-Attheya_sp.AAC.3
MTPVSVLSLELVSELVVPLHTTRVTTKSIGVYGSCLIGVVELEGYHARKQRDSEDFRGNLRAPNRLPH